MMRRRSFRRGAAFFKRERPRIPSSGKAFLIVTEGSKTEPNYLKKLRDRLQLAAADVVISHPEGTDPITLTREAIKLRDARKEEAKRGYTIEYDEIWVVFDLEKPHDRRRELATQAMAMSEASEIYFATSDPCFEYWLLLHKEYTTAPFTDCCKVVKRLKKHWPDYTKGQAPLPEVLKNIPIAVVNAKRCRDHHKTSGGDGNPSTEMDNLVRSLNTATRAHFQFQLD